MWGSLSRADDLIAIVKGTTSLKELVSLRTYLSNPENTALLRDGTVHQALLEIPKQIHKVVAADPLKVLSEIAEFIF
jgi:hypothetical protein